MNILFVTHSFLPFSKSGVENYVYKTALTLQKTGHKVLILTAVFDPLKEDLHRFNYEYKGIGVEAFYHNLSSEDFIDTFIDVQKDRIFSSLLESFNADIVHLQHLMFHSTGYLNVLRERGIPVVLTLHDYYYYCPNLGQRLFLNRFICRDKFPLKCAICYRTSKINVHPIDILLYKKFQDYSFFKKISNRFPTLTATVKWLSLLRKSPTIEEILLREREMLSTLSKIDVLIAPSLYFKDFFERYSGHQNIIHLDYGFDISAQKIIKNTNNKRLRLGFIGTISRHKGAHLLIEIAERFSNAIEIIVYGNDKNDRRLSERIKSLSAVRYRGLYDPDDIKEIFRDIDYLLVPSIWEENSPLIIHEALIFDTPVIASCRGGIGELIIEGKNGFLFDPDNPDCLFELLSRLVRDKIRFGNLDKTVILPIDEHIKRLLTIYDGLTSKH